MRCARQAGFFELIEEYLTQCHGIGYMLHEKRIFSHSRNAECIRLTFNASQCTIANLTTEKHLLASWANDQFIICNIKSAANKGASVVKCSFALHLLGGEIDAQSIRFDKVAASTFGPKRFFGTAEWEQPTGGRGKEWSVCARSPR